MNFIFLKLYLLRSYKFGNQFINTFYIYLPSLLTNIGVVHKGEMCAIQLQSHFVEKDILILLNTRES